jgi:flagellar motor switch protein FliN
MPEELSQDDIDALLGDGGGDGELSGNDIDALLGGVDQGAMELPDFGGGEQGAAEGGEAPAHGIEMLYDVELRVRVELGRTKMKVSDILRLREGSVVKFDKDAGAQVDIMVNDRLVAHGEVLVLNDLFCVRVTEVLSEKDRALLRQIG